MSLPTCHQCQEPIEQVQLLRVGPHRFHPDHFVCHECGQNLREQQFHFREGHFFCGTHFLRRFAKDCAKCGQKIKPGHVIQAFGKYFHPDHFTCEVCGEPFPEGQYYELEGAAYCAAHYIVAANSSKCHHCGKRVPDLEAVRVQNNVYHTDCLFCGACQTPLESEKGSVFQHEGQIFCRQDYLLLFAPLCTLCGLSILDNCITANHEHYHRACFQCSVCQTALVDYIRLGAHLRCEQHVHDPAPVPQCDLCGESVKSGLALACGQVRHKTTCFSCARCSAALQLPHVQLHPDQRQDLVCRVCYDEAVAHRRLSNGKPASSVSSSSSSVSSSSSPPSSSSPSSPSSSSSSQAPSSLPEPSQASATSRENSTAAATTPSPGAGADQTDSPVNLDTEPSQPLALVSSAEDEGEQEEEEEEKKSPPASPKERDKDKKRDKRSSSKSRSKSSGKCTIQWKRGNEIGRGAFGRVYMALIEDTGELIAVKQVKLDKYDDNLALIASMESEIALMETLRHPNIVHFLGTQRRGNKFNILMEYIPGNSLDQILSKFGPFSESMIRSYTTQLLSALAYCHANQVVHRDIKARNILVDTKGNLKLADFGSAKRFETETLGKAAPSLSYNYTPLWTAPEVLTGKYDSKVDIWSLGCVIVEMGSGKAPWSECKFENPFRALYHIGNSNTIPELPSKLSAQATAFLKLCLTRDPEKRPSAEQLLQHSWIVGSKPPSASSPVSSPAPAPVSLPAPVSGAGSGEEKGQKL